MPIVSILAWRCNLAAATHSPRVSYSSECVKGVFSELRLDGVLRSSLPASYSKLRQIFLKAHELGVRLEHPPEGDPPYVVRVEE